MERGWGLFLGSRKCLPTINYWNWKEEEYSNWDAEERGWDELVKLSVVRREGVQKFEEGIDETAHLVDKERMNILKFPKEMV